MERCRDPILVRTGISLHPNEFIAGYCTRIELCIVEHKVTLMTELSVFFIPSRAIDRIVVKYSKAIWIITCRAVKINSA